MNLEKLIQASPPSIQPILSVQPMSYTIPTIKSTSTTIEKNTVDEFLILSRVYLGLDKNS